MGRWKDQSTKMQETNLNDTKGCIFPTVDSWKLLSSLNTLRSRPWPKAVSHESNFLLAVSLKGKHYVELSAKNILYANKIYNQG